MQDAVSSSVEGVGREVLGHQPRLNRYPSSAGRDASQALLLLVWAVGPAHGGRAGCRLAERMGRGRIAWSTGRLGSLLVDRRGSLVTCHLPPK